MVHVEDVVEAEVTEADMATEEEDTSHVLKEKKAMYNLREEREKNRYMERKDKEEPEEAIDAEEVTAEVEVDSEVVVEVAVDVRISLKVMSKIKEHQMKIPKPMSLNRTGTTPSKSILLQLLPTHRPEGKAAGSE